METIIASLIIACSNLIQPVEFRSSDKEAIKIKKECIQRVANCVDSLSFMERDQFFSVLKKCSDKVY